MRPVSPPGGRQQAGPASEASGALLSGPAYYNGRAKWESLQAPDASGFPGGPKGVGTSFFLPENSYWHLTPERITLDI